MTTEPSSDPKFDIGHVLFIDIVGYSKLLISDQSDLLQKLKEIVRGTEQFRLAEAEGKLMRLPTGDGGALVFRNSPEAPALCALEISQALKNHPELRVRMGIHSGPVNEITDLNEQANIAGAGINMAQRVMDCGDAGHILLSKHVAEDLEHYARWRPHLHDLGECEVKHGEVISVVNLYTDDAGNSQPPRKFKARKASKERVPKADLARPRSKQVLIAAAVLAAALVVGLLLFGRLRPLTSKFATNDKSIAVLPFDNLSDEKQNAYFAEGIHDEILTRLAKIGALKVISRTSTQQYQSKPGNLSEIAKQLGVANILEGSVQKAAGAVHINVQLIRAATDDHLWAESYDRKLDDIFGVEGEVAGAIAEALNAKLTGAEQKAVEQKPTNNSQAYEAYLRGIAINAQTSEPATTQRAWQQFSEAVRLDPQFALAWAQKARLDSFLYFNEMDASPQRLAEAKLASETAMKLQPESGDSWLAKGSYEYRCLRNYEAALSSYREAERRLPNSAEVSAEIGYVERRMGKFRESIADQERAIERDPRNSNFLSELAGTYTAVREYAKAHNLIDRVLVITPGDQTAVAQKLGYYLSEGKMDDAEKLIGQIPVDTGNTWAQRARVRYFLYRRQYDQAIAELKSIFARPDFSLHEGNAWCYPTLGWAQQWKGDAAMAKATFTEGRERLEALRQDTTTSRLLVRWLSSVYAGLGEKEAALREAQQAVATMADDAFYGPNAQVNLAQIEARFGEVDSCMSRLSRLLQMPAGLAPLTPLTIADLKLNPAWDPVRSDPRFQKLIEERQP